MRRLALSGLLTAAAALSGFVLAGCGNASSATPPTTSLAGSTGASTQTTATSPPPTTTAPAATTGLEVYFLRNGKVAVARRSVPETRAIATAALAALAAGPDGAERSAGLSSDVPAGGAFHGLQVDGGVATVTAPGGLSRTAEAQVVYTLTQFPTVQSVALDGRTLSRSDFEDVTPAILVESPTVGETVQSPLRISGTANTFEATFVVKLVAGSSGAQVFQQVVTATSGSGTRGTFDVTVPFSASAGPATLVAFEESAENGRPVHEVEIPLSVR
jgi:hypothetical protein